MGVPDNRINLIEMQRLPLLELVERVEGLELAPAAACVAKPLFDEVLKRVRFLIDVGLGYLTLRAKHRAFRAAECSAFVWQDSSAPV